MKKNFTEKLCKGVLASMLALSGLVPSMTFSMTKVKAANDFTVLGAVSEVETEENVVYVTYAGGEKTKITFLENDIFRFNMDPEGNFEEYPKPNSASHTATIVQQSDSSDEYSKPVPTVELTDSTVIISTDKIKLEIDKSTALMRLTDLSTSKVVWEELVPLQYSNGTTVQTLKKHDSENFYGGGTQNGRFVHTGEKIEIKNTNNWVDGGVASPNPFYWSTAGYGVLRDTWKPGTYDFGNTDENAVVTAHNEKRFDAYYFVDAAYADILNDYYQVTGNPILLPENSYYLAHLNCYNRDAWSLAATGGNLLEDGNRYNETNRGGATIGSELLETLNGTNSDDYKFSARAVIDGYVNNDMPFGWFLPNDGYGCGYGQSDTNLDDNIDNLKQFTEYANSYGITTGLWTQSNLTPDASQPIHLQRDFYKEVNTGGIRNLKTDVAWVGSGYSFGLNGIKQAYEIITATGDRPNIVTLDGWAGTQRYGGIWTGDQTGGNWEYIRFHIPTYIGQSLSGNPNIGSDMDGIFGGGSIVTTRDYQWKVFTQYMLNMDGWGSYPKKPYIFGEDTTSINRMYLKLKAELMPYLYTTSYEATTGLPSIRAMFLNYPDDSYAYSKDMQYQFMFGEDFLVAPIYQNTAADAKGNDIRNGIYLPDENEIWIDYFSGQQYRGGQVLNNFDAPIWKLPLFVRNGAIIPMYAENNNPMPVSETNTKGLDKTIRIIEFYPDGESSYVLYEDNGTSIDGTNLEEINYGAHVTTKFTSSVNGTTAVLTAHNSVGSYDGYDPNRDTTFVVNVSKAPTGISGKVGSKNITFTQVTTQEAFDAATGNVYFYNEAPNMNKYATEGSDFSNVEIITTPKLYVKVEKTNVNDNAITVTINGFENKQPLSENKLNEDLAVPTNLRTNEEEITPTEIPLFWDEVDGATEYQIEADGIILGGISGHSFVHAELAYHSTHTYRVRALNANGYSNWSDPIEVTSALDPYRNMIPGITVSTKDAASGYDVNRLIDREFTNYWFTDWNSSEVNNRDKVFDFNLQNIYKMDKVDIYPHDSYLKKQPLSVSAYGSTDGINYTLVSDHVTFEADATIKELPLNGEKMRYLRVVVHEPANTYIAMTEMMPQKVDGTSIIVYGDVTSDGKVDGNDLTMMQNYVGLTPVDADWEYVADKGCDFNSDNVIDAFDVAVVANIVNNTSGNKDVAGQVAVVANKSEVKANETVEINLLGLGMENVSAFSVQMPYDASKFDFVSISNAPASALMTTFSKPRAHSDGTNEIFAVYSNVDTKTLIDGTTLLGTIVLRAKEDCVWDQEAVNAKLVGNNNSVVENALVQISDEEPQETERYRQIVISADQITSQADNPLQSNMGVDKLVDGQVDSDSYRFEFKWGDSQETVGASLPHELTYNFDKPRAVVQLRVQIRHSGDSLNTGALKDFELYGLDAEGNRTLLGTYKMTQYDQYFEFNTEGTAYSGVVLKAISSQGGLAYKLNIDETTFFEKNSVDVTDIDFAANTPTSVVAGRFIQIDGVITPEDATNMNYTVESSDETIAKVLRIKTGDNKFVYALQGISEGEVTITITAADNDALSKEMTVKVLNNDKSTLETLVNKADKYSKVLFTDDSYQSFSSALENAKAVLADENATQNDIDTAETALRNTMNKLVAKKDNLVDNSTVIAIDTSSEITTEEGESGEKENLLDNDPNTYWHTDYTVTAERVMPQHVTFDLGKEYLLNEVSFLSRQGSRNGDIIKAAIEISLDGENFVRVGEYDFENDGNSLLDKETYKDMVFTPEKARYVRFVALSTLGGEKNAYASASEIRFYGFEFADKAGLSEAVENAKAIEKDNYTPNSYKALEEALGKASVVLDDEWATEKDVNDALKAIETAVEGLTLKADKAELEKAIKDAKAIDTSKYTDATVTVLVNAIENAEKVCADENATQTDVNAAIEALTKAIAGLAEIPAELEKVDKTALEKAITDAKAMNTSKYTEESVIALDKAIAAAEKVLADEDATLDDVNLAIIALDHAINGLVEKTTEPGKPGDTPNTNDSMNVLGWMSLIIISAFAFILISKRNKEME